MQVGDLVRQLWGDGMTGILVDWAICDDHTWPAYPVVLWSDGSCKTMDEPDLIGKVDESR